MSKQSKVIVTEKELIKTSYRDLLNKIKSKSHFCYIFKEKGKFYLPPQKYITFRYIKQVLSGQKLLLKKYEVEECFKYPKRKGFNFAKYFRTFMKISEVKKYFPDLTRNQHPPKQFFFDVKIMQIIKSKFPDQYAKIEKIVEAKPQRKNVRIIDKNLYIDKEFNDLLNEVKTKDLDFLLCKIDQLRQRNLLLFPSIWSHPYQENENIFKILAI